MPMCIGARDLSCVVFGVYRLIAITGTNRRLNPSHVPNRYPTADLGVNINRWAQFMIQYAGGNAAEDVNSQGVSNSRHNPKTYFNSSVSRLLALR